MKTLTALFALLAASAAVADITLTGVNYIDASTTISDKVTGSGYYEVRKGAKLTLTNAANNFTGGIVVSHGVAQANAAGAFGTGDVTLAYSDDAQYAQVVFNAAGATFSNRILKTGKGFREKYPDVCVIKNATLSGKILLSCASPAATDIVVISAGDTSSTVTSQVNYSTTVTLTGEIDVGAGGVYLYGFSPNYKFRGKIVFSNKVTAHLLQTGYASAHIGTVEIWSPQNRIENLVLKNFHVDLMAANVLSGAIVEAQTGTWSMMYERALVDMNGYDQSIRYMTRSDNTGVGTDAASYSNQSVGFRSTKKATLTITGKAGASDSGSTDMALLGAVDLVIDKVDGSEGLVQQFSRRYGTSTGAVRVADGTLRLRDGAKFQSVPSLSVSGGSVVEFENTTGTFPVLTAAEVDGKVAIQSGCTTVVSDALTLTLGSSGIFAVYKNHTCTISDLYVNGRYMPPGTYTKDRASWMVEGGSYSSNYTGSLVVTKGGEGGVMVVW